MCPFFSMRLLDVSEHILNQTLSPFVTNAGAFQASTGGNRETRLPPTVQSRRGGTRQRQRQGRTHGGRRRPFPRLSVRFHDDNRGGCCCCFYKFQFISCYPVKLIESLFLYWTYLSIFIEKNPAHCWTLLNPQPCESQLPLI